MHLDPTKLGVFRSAGALVFPLLGLMCAKDVLAKAKHKIMQHIFLIVIIFIIDNFKVFKNDFRN